jgi:phosphoribosylcarboxyaminoimidazole (NCAIR) mutase
MRVYGGAVFRLDEHLARLTAQLADQPRVADGLDALLSTVQLPPGVPVACVGINNARNAGVLAARILCS